jgi:hypothetical protein
MQAAGNTGVTYSYDDPESLISALVQSSGGDSDYVSSLTNSVPSVANPQWWIAYDSETGEYRVVNQQIDNPSVTTVEQMPAQNSPDELTALNAIGTNIAVGTALQAEAAASLRTIASSSGGGSSSVDLSKIEEELEGQAEFRETLKMAATSEAEQRAMGSSITNFVIDEMGLEAARDQLLQRYAEESRGMAVNAPATFVEPAASSTSIWTVALFGRTFDLDPMHTTWYPPIAALVRAFFSWTITIAFYAWLADALGKGITDMQKGSALTTHTVGIVSGNAAHFVLIAKITVILALTLAGPTTFFVLIDTVDAVSEVVSWAQAKEGPDLSVTATSTLQAGYYLFAAVFPFGVLCNLAILRATASLWLSSMVATAMFLQRATSSV